MKKNEINHLRYVNSRTRPVQDAPTAWESGLTSKQKKVAASEKATNRAAITIERRVIPNSGTPHGLQAEVVPAIMAAGGDNSDPSNTLYGAISIQLTMNY